MISQCPNCQTRFKVSRAQLQAAKGTVRCGACSTRFDAIANEARPTPPAGSASNKNSDSDQITKQWFSELLNAGDNPETGISPTEATQQTADDPLQNIAAQPIELAQPGNAKRRGGTLIGWAGCLALFLLLVAQWQLASQTPATGTGWKRYLYTACNYLHCKPADTSGLVKVTSLRITPHPQQAEALQIDASILNTAGNALPAPVLAINFSNLAGASVAYRQFRPAEYLGGELLGQQQLPAKTPVFISLEIVDPGEHAVNYTVDLLPTAR